MLVVHHVHRVRRHIHIRIKEQHRRTIAMRPKRRPVRKMHVLNPQAVIHIRVIRVRLGLVHIVIIIMQPMGHVRPTVVHKPQRLTVVPPRTTRTAMHVRCAHR